MSGSPLRVVALIRSNESKRALQLATTEAPGLVLDIEVGELAAMQGMLSAKLEKADILFVEFDSGDSQEQLILRRITEEHRGRLAIIATAPEVDTLLLRRLMRDGVDDCVPQPLGHEEVAEALAAARRRISRSRGTGHPAGKVIGVTRAKGGAGASTVALNLARLLSRPGKKGEAGKRVCLVDLDLQFGDLASMLDLASRQHIGEIIQEPQRLDATLLHSMAARHASGPYLIPAPPELLPLDTLKPEVIGSLVDLARDEFDYLVLDLPLAIAAWTQTVLARLDLLILVAQLTVPTIRQTRRFLDLLNDEGMFGLPAMLVLNRHSASFGQRNRIREAEQALDQPFAGFLRNDPQVGIEAVNRGAPVDLVAPRSRLCRDLHTLAGQVEKKLAERDRPAPPLAAA
jgi:pilus assembly protein CpaE